MKSNILIAYSDRWVALNKTRDKVLYAAKTLDSLHKLVNKKGEKDVVLHYVPPFNANLSP